MKALSVQEPWLSMIIDGKKTIETRTWAPAAYGDILLVGSKKPKGRFSGMAACVIHLNHCRQMIKSDEAAACCKVYPGAYSWCFSHVRKVKPFAVTGRLGLYEVPIEIIRANQIDF